jgi:RNA polymerase sigma factor (sigma-70 family)
MRRNLVRYFEGRGFPFAEDHADEAINRIAKRLDEGEQIGDLNSYSYGVARLLILEILKERAKEERALKEMPSLRLVQPDPLEPDEMSSRLECLNNCLEALSPDNRTTITEYYRGDNRSRIENRKSLGTQLGVSNQILRSRAVRLREKLEGCLTSCLKNA